MNKVSSLLITLTAFLYSPAFTFAGDVALPVPTTPQQMEVSSPPAPIEMMVEDAERLNQQMRNNSILLQPQPRQPQLPAEVPSANGVSNTIKLDVPEVVNKTPYFNFRDITDRSGNNRAVRTMNERRSAVEQYRQSVIKKR